MENFRVKRILEKDGELFLTGLPFKKGQEVEMIFKPVSLKKRQKAFLTAKKLLESGLPGMWADRQDIKDSSAFARELREKAQRRER
ncbi:MAG: hypothetical protein HPY58_05995 [Firmicutes bacterium]|nr:hypothetical protein [Bacillota bacterium]